MTEYTNFQLWDLFQREYGIKTFTAFWNRARRYHWTARCDPVRGVVVRVDNGTKV